MIVYRDALGEEDDEYFSDSYPNKVVNDVLYEIEAKYVQKEDSDDENEKVVNLVQAHGLVETAYTKKQYVGHIKKYMKALKANLEKNNPERVEAFTKGAQKVVKSMVMKNFNDYQFYTSKSMNPELMTVLCKWSSDGKSILFYVWKDGVVAEKY